MSDVVEAIAQGMNNLQKVVGKAIPYINKAFPADDMTLVVSKLHPIKVEEPLVALSSVIQRLTAHADDLVYLLPSSDFDHLNNAIMAASSHIDTPNTQTSVAPSQRDDRARNEKIS